MSHSSRRGTVPLLALGLSLAPVSAWAQGFGLNEIGTCAEARGFANTGAPCNDASTIYWNPAGATTLTGFSLYGGASALRVMGSFTQDTTGKKYNSNVPWTVPPDLFLNYTTLVNGHRLAVGVGAYVPYGLISQWRSDFPGRFEAQRASLNTIYFQPNIGYEIIPGRLSVGAGPVIGYSTVALDQAQDLSTQIAAPLTTFGQLGIPSQTEFAVAHLRGNTHAYGFNAGVHATVTPDIQLGARFLSQLVFDYKNATATFQQVATGLVLPATTPLGPAGTPIDAVLAGEFQKGALTNQQVDTKITHPWQFQLGLGYTGFSQTTLSVDYALVGYSGFTALPIEFQGPAAASSKTLLEDYHDSWSIRTGVQHVWGDPVLGFVGRVGFSYVNTPAPDVTVTPLLPDMNRYNYSVGFGYPFSKHVSLDATYLHTGTQGRRGRIAERSDVENTTATADQLNSGFYNLTANIISLSLKLSY